MKIILIMLSQLFSLLVVISINPVIAAINYTFLLVIFGIILVLINETFLGFIHIIVYAGAMAILFTFITFMVKPKYNAKIVYYNRLYTLAISFFIFITGFGCASLPFTINTDKYTYFLDEIYQYPYVAIWIGFLLFFITIGLNYLLPSKNSSICYTMKTVRLKRWKKNVTT